MDDRELGELIDEAEYQARSRFHEYVTSEHLLYVLLTYPAVQQALEAIEVNWRGVKDQLESFFETKLPRAEVTDAKEVQQTLAFQRILQRAILHAEYSSASSLAEEDILAAVFTEPDSHAAFFLKQQGASRLTLLEYLSSRGQEGWDDESDPINTHPEEAETSTLNDYVTDLTEQAERGELDPLIGREKELARIIQILARRNKNNPLFVGDQGVGKTALAEGLALRVVEGALPESLKRAQSVFTRYGFLVSGHALPRRL